MGFALLSRALIYFILFTFFAIIILFPSEVRRALWKLSAPKELRETFQAKYDVSDEELINTVENIVRSTQNMAKKNIGALIIIVPEGLPGHILESGIAIGGKVSSALIETIFHDKTPLHDGAVCIQGNRVVAAGCFLPLSQDSAIDKELGTRHRAAIGITESYKVFSIIVSEETGVISTAQAGKLTRYYDSDMLRDILMQVYGLKTLTQAPKVRKRKTKG